MTFQPVQYNVGGINPLQSALQGYQAGQALRDEGIKRQQAAAAQARKAQMNQALMDSDGSLESIQGLIVSYPELSKNLENVHKNLSEQQKISKAGNIARIYSASQAGEMDIATQELDEQLEAAKNSGNTKDIARLAKLKRILEENPQAASNVMGIELEFLSGGKLSDILKASQPSKSFSVLTDKEKTDLGLDPKKAYQVGSDGKITSIGGGGITINTGDQAKVGTIPKGYQLTQTEDGKYQMEIIPGGPVDKEAKELAKKKFKTEELTARSENVVLDNIDNAISKITEAKIPIVGVLASKVAPDFRQSRVDLENLVKTIRSNIGFNRLQEMREASKTGGALGAVSERELDTLESVLGSLSLSQSKDQLINNLNTIKSIMQKDAAYRSRVAGQMVSNVEAKKDISNQVSELEKSLGRPLTEEEKAYLESKGGK